MDDDIIKWIQQWYADNCNGDWEHSYGIHINTLDNPGWEVIIDLANTSQAQKIIEYNLIEKNENDWYGFSIKNSQFIGIGDPHKLKIILNQFRRIIEGDQ